MVRLTGIVAVSAEEETKRLVLRRTMCLRGECSRNVYVRRSL